MIEKLKIVHKILNHQEAIVFKKYTLIYGNNGVGKTTLTKCFKMLEKNNTTNLASTDIFETNSAPFNSEENSNLFIRVFNGTDYISENITGSGKNKIGFILGEDKIKLEAEKAIIIKYIDALKPQIEKFSSKNKDDLAKLIASTNVERHKYYAQDNRIKPTFQDLLDGDKADLKSLSNSELMDCKATMDLKNPLDLINQNYVLASLKRFDIDEIGNLFNTKFDGSVIEKNLNDLEQYLSEADINFIKQGMKMPKFKNEDSCPFCLKPLGELKQTLITFFDRADEQLKQQLRDKINELELILNSLNQPSFEVCKKFYPEAGTNARYVLEEYSKHIAEYKIAISDLIGEISNKLDGNEVVFNFNEFLKNITNIMGYINNTVASFNSFISDHNHGIDQFKDKQKEARAKITKHFAISIYDRYQELKQAVKTDDEKLASLKQDKQEKDDELIGLNIKLKELFNLQEPVEEYNRNLCLFLGRDDIALALSDDKSEYILKRNGKDAQFTSFSEGEKTAIALIHFMLLLKDAKSGKEMKDCIVVIDDPIASFDNNNLYMAYAFISSNLGGNKVKQLIVLTHHFHFFKRLQRWVQQFKKENEKLYCLYQIKRCDNTSQIEILDKMIEDHESEYQALLKHLKNIKNKKDYKLSDLDKISLPNILRQVLETFAVVVRPFSGDSFGKVLESELKKECSKKIIDINECLLLISYLDMYANTLSHNRKIGDTSYNNNSRNYKKDVENTLAIIETIMPRHLKD